MNTTKELHDQLTGRIAKKYKKDGYKVYIEPKNPNLPFDLGLYHPDLLAIKSKDDGYVIEIKDRASNVSVDKLREIAETVTQHSGWHFLLVTGDDVSPNEAEQGSEKLLLSWEQIISRNEKGKELLSLGETEGAFLAFWGVLEAVMRKQAEQVSIPIERFPTSSLIKHLYSQGEISIEQFDKIMELLNVRNQFVHGFQSQYLNQATTKELKNLVTELIESWQPK
ncbi:MAG: hypothetical protein WA821_06465 [Anaerolineales bacterium]